MRTMTATEASRHFSEVLDLVEAGETVRITRGSQLIAEMTPARRRTGADLEAAIASADLAPLDDAFERDIAEAMVYVTAEGSDPWADA